MYKFLFIFLFTVLVQKNAAAQDTLPKITVSQLGKKVLISWVNPFSYVTDINIQRSADSLKNFSTIGTVLNIKSASNGFVDPKEFIPSNQYYRLFIAFEGGSYLFTKSRRPSIDTSSVAPQAIEYQPTTKTWFVPSKHIYTGKDNNVIIALPDAEHKKYSLKFFDDDGSLLFELKKISLPFLTLDKVNFGHSGLFHFELFENKIIVERHKVFIPKDGKPMPSLDVEGREINR